MFGCIVVATDLRAPTRLSLATACDLLHSEGQVLLVHVIRPVAGLPDAERDALYDRMRASAGRQLHDLAAGFIRERGRECLCLCVIGTPGPQIARIAEERGADLVILAHDPSDDPATLGSVSYQVAHHAPCAVLVLKTPERRRPATGGVQRPRAAPVPTGADAVRDSRRTAR
jgi:nucleotide-binding universal stress UspA family protein